jgi:quaternary ammonium compound-resistance protein SugE
MSDLVVIACSTNGAAPQALTRTTAVLIVGGEDGLVLPWLSTGTARTFMGRAVLMAWIYLILAGLLEIVWAFFMKKSAGFTLLVPGAITIVTMIASFALLSISMKGLPLGTAYTIWTGIGAVGAFALGVVVLGEAATPMRLLAAGMIVVGIVLMRLSGTTA